MPGEKEALSRMRQKGKRRGGLILLLCVVFALLVMVMYAYLLPPYSLSGQRSIGARLLLPVQISSSIPGWSVYVCCFSLLLLIAYTGALSRCATFFYGACAKEKHARDWLILLIAVLSLPCSVFYSHALQNLLIDLLPYRAIPYLIALLAASAGAMIQSIQKRKQT